MKKKSDEKKKGGLGRVSTVVIGLVSLVVIAMFSLGVVAVSSTESTCEEYVMDEIYSGGVKDIVFQDANGICLYINRGEDRYSIEDLRSALLGKKAVYTFTRCGWAKAHSLRRIVCEGRVVYES